METKTESKYERLRKIGIGSYGVVFKCVNRQSGQIVAIKRYTENDTDPIIRKIAMREVRMLRQLRHPNLIHLIEVFRRKRRLHLVFEYCELTVLDVIERYANNCPLNLMKKIVWQLANGVSYCHAHNCIHRDIKPENILVNQAGVVKLCDFGFARNWIGCTTSTSRLSGSSASSSQQLGREAQLLGVSLAQVSQYSGEVHQQVSTSNKENSSERQALTEYVATRWYRAPELLVGEVYYDTKIDIWAIGCVTAELMRGEPLWPGKTDFDQLSLIKNSLGNLTQNQTSTLVTACPYDQASIERLLSPSPQPKLGESLERRLPCRVGQSGLDFVFKCLQMDPARRATSEQLLQHSFIHSVRMSQFVASTQTIGQSSVSSAASLAKRRTPSTTLAQKELASGSVRHNSLALTRNIATATAAATPTAAAALAAEDYNRSPQQLAAAATALEKHSTPRQVPKPNLEIYKLSPINNGGRQKPKSNSQAMFLAANPVYANGERAAQPTSAFLGKQLRKKLPSNLPGELSHRTEVASPSSPLLLASRQVVVRRNSRTSHVGGLPQQANKRKRTVATSQDTPSSNTKSMVPVPLRLKAGSDLKARQPK